MSGTVNFAITRRTEAGRTHWIQVFTTTPVIVGQQHHKYGVNTARRLMPKEWVMDVSRGSALNQ